MMTISSDHQSKRREIEYRLTAMTMKTKRERERTRTRQTRRI